MKPSQWGFVNPNKPRTGTLGGYEEWKTGITVVPGDTFYNAETALRATQAQGVAGHERVTASLV